MAGSLNTIKMFVQFVTTAILIGLGSGSDPAATDDRDGLQLLLNAALAVAPSSEGAVHGMGDGDDESVVEEGTDTDEEVWDEDDEEDREVDAPLHRAPEGRATGKRQRIGGEPRDEKRPPITRLRDPFARAERERLIREYVGANPDLARPALLRGLVGHIGHSYSEAVLLRWVRKARISLGHAVQARFTPAQARRRDEIVDHHVSRNPSLSHPRLAELIVEQLVTENLFSIARSKSSIYNCITNARKRLSKPGTAERLALIEGFVRDNLGSTVASMLEPAKQLLQARLVPEIRDVDLFDTIYKIKRDLLTRRALEQARTMMTTAKPPTTTTPTTTTTVLCPGVSVVESVADSGGANVFVSYPRPANRRAVLVPDTAETKQGDEEEVVDVVTLEDVGGVSDDAHETGCDHTGGETGAHHPPPTPTGDKELDSSAASAEVSPY